MDTSRCVVLVLHPGRIAPGCEAGLQELEKLGYAVRRVGYAGPVEPARSAAADRALADGFDDLVWVDPDVGFAADQVGRLRGHPAAVVGGVLTDPHHRGFGCEFLPGTPVVTLGAGGGPVAVRAVDLGFCLTRRAAFDAARKAADLSPADTDAGPATPWFLPALAADGANGRWRADGRAFCDRVRRGGLGVLADTSLRLWRAGTCGYSWEDAWGVRERHDTFRFAPPDPYAVANRNPLRAAAEPLPDGFPRLGLYIVTIERNRDSLNRTLDSVRQSDWGAEPAVLTQPPDWPIGHDAASANYRRAIDAALADGCDFAVILEDDVRVSRHLRHNLTRCPLVARDQCDYLSLLMPDLIASPWVRAEPHLGYRLAKPMFGKAVDWTWVKYKLWGAQGYVLSRRLLAAAAERWNALPGGQDERVCTLAEWFRLPMWYTMPCLVQHDPTQTAFGTPLAYAADFDPDWKLAPSDGYQPPEAVPDWLTEDEGRLLWEQAAGKHVLEVGAAYGRATVCLAQRADRVVAVDTGDLSEAAEWVRRYGRADRVQFRRGDIARVCGELAGPFELAFINGQADAAAITRAIDAVRPLVPAGGRLAFHDYPDTHFPDVRRVVDDHARRLGWKRVAQADFVGVFAV